MEGLSEAMRKLRESAQRLNAVTDIANRVVSEAEDFLTSSGIGTYACVIVDHDETGIRGISSYRALAYKRSAGRYRIVVEWGRDDEPETDDKPWAECPRDVKLEAVRVLPELLVEIAKKLDSKVNEAEAIVTRTADAVRAALPRREGR